VAAMQTVIGALTMERAAAANSGDSGRGWPMSATVAGEV
jgi:hypothetical protein